MKNEILELCPSCGMKLIRRDQKMGYYEFTMCPHCGLGYQTNGVEESFGFVPFELDSFGVSSKEELSTKVSEYKSDDWELPIALNWLDEKGLSKLKLKSFESNIKIYGKTLNAGDSYTYRGDYNRIPIIWNRELHDYEGYTIAEEKWNAVTVIEGENCFSSRDSMTSVSLSIQSDDIEKYDILYYSSDFSWIELLEKKETIQKIQIFIPDNIPEKEIEEIKSSVFKKEKEVEIKIKGKVIGVVKNNIEFVIEKCYDFYDFLNTNKQEYIKWENNNNSSCELISNDTSSASLDFDKIPF